MKIDKKNGKVCYNDEQHIYWDDEEKYISVTTLIHKYQQPFDGDFWSAYKALEKLLSKEAWALEKKSLLATKRFDKSLLALHGIDENDFNKVQQDILDEWEKTKVQSCERGTKIHAQLENEFYKKPKVELKKYGLGGKFTVKKDSYDLNADEKQAYPEFLIYYISPDKKIRIAGQVDLLIKDGNDIYIIDYKTNKKLDQKSGFDVSTRKNATMLYPLNNLMDCNFMHYTLQLSTYAYMIQQMNPDFVIKGLMLIHYDHDGNVTEHSLDYVKDDVIRMIDHYKKESIKEQQRKRRQRIEY